MKIYSIISTR